MFSFGFISHLEGLTMVDGASVYYLFIMLSTVHRNRAETIDT